MTPGSRNRSGGYLTLLRSNPDFNRLWIGQVISQTGDWFNSVALFTLILSLTGSSQAVGYVLILKLLPAFFVGPLAGVVADRFNRKIVMIVSDILRGLLVLGFLFTDRPDQIWIVYTLAAMQVIVSTFFDPAKSAAIPGIVSREQLIAANTLSGVAWSATLAFGAALGGAVTNAFGTHTAFAIDSASYFLSAAFISFVRLRHREQQSKEASTRRTLSVADATGITDIFEGARYLRSNRRVMALLLVKSGWGLGGGVLLLLAIFGKKVFPLGRDGSTAIGLLYAARGVGALIGTVVVRWMTDGSTRTMRRAITASFIVSMLFYLAFAGAPLFWLAMLCVVGAHAGGSINWVFSTTLLQMSVPDRFLGRVFALDTGLVTLTISLSTWVTGLALDYWQMAPRQVAAMLGLTFLIPGVAWFLIQRRMNRSEHGVTAEGGQAETSFPPA